MSHSVEERMYTRIDQRLKGYNLAVGEFPEVVAESIRRSILDDAVEDDSLRLLQDIRNSLQTEALSALWNRGSCGQTKSQAFRVKLLDDIAERARCEMTDSGETTVYLRDGETETVTPEEGNRETISLSSKCVIEYYPSLSGYLTAIDGDGRDCAYACGDSILNPELLPEALGGTTDFSSLEMIDRPKWLPDVGAMSLAYTVEYEPSVPNMWPLRIGVDR